jgi:hypothetical protein
VSVAAVILVVVAVAGFGLLNRDDQGLVPGGDGPTATPAVTTAAGTALPSYAPRSTPRPIPTAGGDVVTGRQTCTEASAGSTATVAGVVEIRNQVLLCADTATDPRLAGDLTVTMNSDEHPTGEWYGWGTVELRNDGGAWSGYFVIASTSSAATMEFDGLWVGSGGYEGLEAIHHVVSAGGSSTLTSRIFEAGPVTTGTETCVTTDAGAQVTVGEVAASRGIVMRCTDTMTDARVTGQRSITTAIDANPDLSAELWGISSLTNAAGAWDGMFFGTVNAGSSEHALRGLMRGTGGFEGLVFRLDVGGTGSPGFDITGEIIQGF